MSIDISEKGIKFDYARYMADSAPGFVTLLLIILNFQVPVITVQPFPATLLTHSSKEIKSYVGIILFLLATPIGLVINAAGWFLLGWLQHCAERISFGANFLLKTTKREFQIEAATKTFGLNSSNWIGKSREIANSLQNEFPEIYTGYRYIEGGRIFCRNMAFIALAVGVLRAIDGDRNCYILGICFLMSMVFMMLSGCISFYYQLALVHRFRTLDSNKCHILMNTEK